MNRVREAMLSVLDAGPAWTRELADRAGCSGHTALYHLHRMKGEGLVEVESRKSARGPVRWKRTGAVSGTP